MKKITKAVIDGEVVTFKAYRDYFNDFYVEVEFENFFFTLSKGESAEGWPIKFLDHDGTHATVEIKSIQLFFEFNL